MDDVAAQSSPPPSADAPPPEELLKKIHELELGHAHLKQEMSKLLTSSAAEIITADRARSKQRSHSMSPRRWRTSGRDGGVVVGRRRGSASLRLQRENRNMDGTSDHGCSADKGAAAAESSAGNPDAVKLTDKQYLDILQSMGQAVHIMDADNRLIYWNRSAENLYGYSEGEALGHSVFDLLVDPLFYSVGNDILNRVSLGENWTGQFPVKNKRGDRFSIIATDTALYDDAGNLIGIICVSSDSRSFKEGTPTASNDLDTELTSSVSMTSPLRNFATSRFGADHQQPQQAAITSKISNLASKVSNKVKLKMRPTEDYLNRDGTNLDSLRAQCLFDAVVSKHPVDGVSSEPCTPRGDGLKAESWVCKKSLGWPWKGNERDGMEPKLSRFVWPWSQSEQENVPGKKSDSENFKSEIQVIAESHRSVTNEASGSWSSSANVNSTSSSGSFGSSGSGAINKVDADIDSLDYEIPWEDLTIAEQIGQGSCGTVYHGLWFGSDVAVKVFSRQEYSEDVVNSFRQEVSLMKRLRHPNILLFMGAVTSPQRLCIVTEFLPRGSLFQLLQKNSANLEKRRQIHMALDIARGMSYLHHFNPPIIHRDLKSSNLLVDKNWTVKVGDFGLSRLKHETYLTTKTGKGTPQWMAPEVLRNEPSDEKADVYSYGVILWELITHKIPWENLNSMQVVGAVGFMNQQLDIPEDADPQWASLIQCCWHSEPKCRPSFQELVEKLKDMYKQYAQQLQAGRAARKEV